MKLPAIVHTIAERVAELGGTTYLAGGPVRDHHLGRTPKDFDLEVHGLTEEVLASTLEEFGRVNAVGRSFGVYKLSVGGEDLDIALPRRDSKVGPGHRGIQVAGDPWMGTTEACRRRDLTINAMLYDVLTAQTVDPFGGREDLENKVLQHVDPATFVEDPLRALRVVQFAARLEFEVTAELKELCRETAIDELPAERILNELEKLLLQAARPGPGIELLVELEIQQRLLPDLELDGVAEVVDRAAAQDCEPPLRDGLMFAAFLHRSTRPEATLERLRLHTRLGWPIRRRVLDTLNAKRAADDTSLRRLADELPVELPIRLWWAIDPSWCPDALDRAASLGVREGPLPQLVGGEDLKALGIQPGPALGKHLAAVREAQTAGRVSTQAEALALVGGRLRHSR